MNNQYLLQKKLLLLKKFRSPQYYAEAKAHGRCEIGLHVLQAGVHQLQGETEDNSFW